MQKNTNDTRRVFFVILFWTLLAPIRWRLTNNQARQKNLLREGERVEKIFYGDLGDKRWTDNSPFEPTKLDGKSRLWPVAIPVEKLTNCRLNGEVAKNIVWNQSEGNERDSAGPLRDRRTIVKRKCGPK